MSKIAEASTCPDCHKLSDEYRDRQVCPNCEAFAAAEQVEFGTRPALRIVG